MAEVDEARQAEAARAALVASRSGNITKPTRVVPSWSQPPDDEDGAPAPKKLGNPGSWRNS